MFCKVLVGNIPVIFPSTHVVGGQGSTSQASPLKGLTLPKALAAESPEGVTGGKLAASLWHTGSACPASCSARFLHSLIAQHIGLCEERAPHTPQMSCLCLLPWPPSGRTAPAPHVFSHSSSGSDALSWGNRESSLFLLLKCIFTL